MKIFPNNFVVSLSREKKEKREKFQDTIIQFSRAKISRISFSTSWKKERLVSLVNWMAIKKGRNDFQTTLFVLFRAFERREWGTVSSSPSFCFFLRDFRSAQWTVAYIDAWLRKMWKRKPGVGDYISRDAACVFHFFLVADFYLKQFSVKRNRGGKILESILS